ncbi:MAG TPA: hypothetical protein VGW78_07505 [Candidatus Babeliales bacterium]|nr:hypothetical protein [Candidatus Babeliales bacterium]
MVILDDGVNTISILWEDIEIQTTTFFVADNFRMTIPLNGQNPILDLAYWSAITQVTVKIYIGLVANPNSWTLQDLQLFMTGNTDTIEIDPLSARIVLSGRDLTSNFIDSKISNIYPNQSAASIVTQLAQKHGLNYQVTPTSGNVGRIFNNITTNAQNLLSKEVTEWDLITSLAQQSGYVAFMIGDTFYFQPFPSDEASAYILNYALPTFSGGSPTFPGMGIAFRRSLTLSNTINVTVTSPVNPQNGQSVIGTATYKRRASSYVNVPTPPSDEEQNYSFTIPGLTQTQAQQQAQTLAQNIGLHEIQGFCTLPGDNLLLKNSLIKVTGTNSALDQIYYVDNITRRLSVESGYMMQVAFKNSSNNSILQGAA